MSCWTECSAFIETVVAIGLVLPIIMPRNICSKLDYIWTILCQYAWFFEIVVSVSDLNYIIKYICLESCSLVLDQYVTTCQMGFRGTDWYMTICPWVSEGQGTCKNGLSLIKDKESMGQCRNLQNLCILQVFFSLVILVILRVVFVFRCQSHMQQLWFSLEILFLFKHFPLRFTGG